VRISVTTPTYGRPNWHRLLYRCYAAQTWEDKELIVLDDSPTPSPFFTELDDPSVRYIHSETRENVGQKRNRLASLATGDLIAHFDDDDYYAPRYLERMAGWIGDAGLVRLASWFIYSQPQSRLWYWDQTRIEEPIHFRLIDEASLDAVPIHHLSAEDQQNWIKTNLDGWGFCFVYRRDLCDQAGFDSVVHGEEGLFTEKVRELGHEVVQAQDREGLLIKLKHAKDSSNLFPQHSLPDFLIEGIFGPNVREHLDHPV
jgi:glycosyltransferase involved in cell wall biosynthesis